MSPNKALSTLSFILSCYGVKKPNEDFSRIGQLEKKEAKQVSKPNKKSMNWPPLMLIQTFPVVMFTSKSGQKQLKESQWISHLSKNYK